MKIIKRIALVFLLAAAPVKEITALDTIETLAFVTTIGLRDYVVRAGYIPSRTYPVSSWQGAVTLTATTLCCVPLSLFVIETINKQNTLPYWIGFSAKALLSYSLTYGIDYAMGKILYRCILKGPEDRDAIRHMPN